MPYCSNCGMEVLESDNFCIGCGTAIRVPNQTDSDDAEPGSTASDSSPGRAPLDGTESRARSLDRRERMDVIDMASSWARDSVCRSLVEQHDRDAIGESVDEATSMILRKIATGPSPEAKQFLLQNAMRTVLRIKDQEVGDENEAAAEWCQLLLSTLAPAHKYWVDQISGGQDEEPASVAEKDWTTCEACGRWPAIPLRIRSTGGYVVYRTMKKTRRVALCKECGLTILKGSQARSGVGVATLNLFAPYALAQNQKWIARIKKLPDPSYE